MSTRTRNLTVADSTELESQVTTFIAQGFVVAQRNETSVTMFKKKSFDFGKYFLGLIMCIVPGVLYILRFAREKNEMVILSVGVPGQIGGAQAGLPTPESLSWSEDRSLWWDGSAWQDAATSVPSTATFSDDGRKWWDGQGWRDAPVVAQGSDPDAETAG